MYEVVQHEGSGGVHRDSSASSLTESRIAAAIVEETEAHELAVAHNASYAVVLAFGAAKPTPTDCDTDTDTNVSGENSSGNITRYPLLTHKRKPIRSTRSVDLWAGLAGTSILLGVGASGTDVATGCALAWNHPRLCAEVSKQIFFRSPNPPCDIYAVEFCCIDAGCLFIQIVLHRYGLAVLKTQ